MSFLKDLGSGILNAVTGGVSGLIGSAFGLPAEAVSNAMSVRDQKELMDYQFQLNQKGIDLQNQFNSPLAQMNRLREANLNPNLVYGSGSVVGNTSDAANASQSKARTAELQKYAQLAQEQTLAHAQSEIENNKKYGNLIDAKVNETNQEIKESEQRVSESKARESNYKNSDTWFWNNYELRRELLENDVALRKGQVRVASETANRLIAQVRNDNRYFDAVIDNIAQSIQQRWKQLDLTAKEIGGKLKYWSQLGSAAQVQAKAALIRSLVGEKEYQLHKDKWDELAPLIKDKMVQSNFGQFLKNKWTELNGQSTLDLRGLKEDYMNQDRYINFQKYFEDYEKDSFLDLLKELNDL